MIKQSKKTFPGFNPGSSSASRRPDSDDHDVDVGTFLHVDAGIRLPFSGPFNCCTWNTAGLCGTGEKAAHRVIIAKRLCRGNDITLLQETHDDGYRFQEYLSELHSTHDFFYNPHANPNAGGANIVIKKTFILALMLFHTKSLTKVGYIMPS